MNKLREDIYKKRIKGLIAEAVKQYEVHFYYHPGDKKGPKEYRNELEKQYKVS